MRRSLDATIGPCYHRAGRERGSRLPLSQGRVPEWLKGTDCKSVGECLRRFDSSPAHQSAGGGLERDESREWIDEEARPVTSHLSPFTSHMRAHIAQLAERILGKDEVPGSNPGVGSSSSGGGTDASRPDPGLCRSLPPN